MARKLKVFQTSLGFFDLAIAAPSMKAAAEAWQSNPDIFKRGFATETTDPKVVAATLAAPGVVLRRPAGSDQNFARQASLPKVPEGRKRAESPGGKERAKDTKEERDAGSSKTEAREQAKREAEEKRDALERKKAEAERDRAKREADEKRREFERKKAEAERERQKKRREQAVSKLDAARERARLQHEDTLRSIGKQREGLDRDEARANEAWEHARKSYDDALKELET